jgi:hypothetical protein
MATPRLPAHSILDLMLALSRDLSLWGNSLENCTKVRELFSPLDAGEGIDELEDGNFRSRDDHRDLCGAGR